MYFQKNIVLCCEMAVGVKRSWASILSHRGNIFVLFLRQVINTEILTALYGGCVRQNDRYAQWEQGEERGLFCIPHLCRNPPSVCARSSCPPHTSQLWTGRRELSIRLLIIPAWRPLMVLSACYVC